MIQESDLIELGFQKTTVPTVISGDTEYYYYTFQPSEDSNFCLISQANDEVKDGWVIGFFEENLEIKHKEDLIQLVSILKRISK